VPYELLNDHCEVILHITGYWPQSYIINLTLILHPLLYYTVLYCPVLYFTHVLLSLFPVSYFVFEVYKETCVLIYDTYVKMGSTRKIEYFGINLRC